MTTFAPAVLSDDELLSKPLPQRPLGHLGWNVLRLSESRNSEADAEPWNGSHP